MTIGIDQVGFGLIAGVLSTLSPCVLPLIPMVLAGAATAHRLGPLALAVGLGVAFAAAGLALATLGQSIGLDQDTFRVVGAVMLIAIGLLLVSPLLQRGLAIAAGPLGDAAGGLMNRVADHGLIGQFLLGLLLGAVWSPCVGPTLGAASLMAARGENLTQAMTVMVMFGIGAGAPLVLLGALGRETFLRWRGRLMSAGAGGKTVMGALLGATGLFVLTGLDKIVEAIVVRSMPEWLVDLTTRY
jgi:cytochrome c biogenesis protein CcdA